MTAVGRSCIAVREIFGGCGRAKGRERIVVGLLGLVGWSRGCGCGRWPGPWALLVGVGVVGVGVGVGVAVMKAAGRLAT